MCFPPCILFKHAFHVSIPELDKIVHDLLLGCKWPRALSFPQKYRKHAQSVRLIIIIRLSQNLYVINRLECEVDVR